VRLEVPFGSSAIHALAVASTIPRRPSALPANQSTALLARAVMRRTALLADVVISRMTHAALHAMQYGQIVQNAP